MDKRFIAVGSTRGPKLDAVRAALKQFGHLLDSGVQFEVQGFDVESGVAHTPRSSAESMRGARQRAYAVVGKVAGQRKSNQYYVGLEGGLEVMNGCDAGKQPGFTPSRRVFLESWAFVSDGWRGHFGRSGAIELPEVLAYEVLDNGVDLAAAIDKFAGMAGVRDSQGAWGVLSSDLITRRDAFRVALVAAFAPFYNANLFRTDPAASEFCRDNKVEGSDRP
jgi:inosine/xanthosine triphosphatase